MYIKESLGVTDIAGKMKQNRFCLDEMLSEEIITRQLIKDR